MKSGSAQDDGNNDPCLEFEDWSPWLWHASEDEFKRYVKFANGLKARLERMSTAARRNLKQINIRCPVNGCRLAIIYWIPRSATPEEIKHDLRMSELEKKRHAPLRNGIGQPIQFPKRTYGYYLYVGRTAGGTEVYDIMNFGFSATAKDDARGCTCCRRVYWRAGCRHGTATLGREYLFEMFMMAERVHHMYYTEEQSVAQLPENLRPFWGKRVFHPDAAAWHPRRPESGHGQTARSGRMLRTN